METALLYLILNITASLFAEISKYLAQNPFQGVASDSSLTWSFRVFYRNISVVADVYGSTKQVATVLCGIGVVLLKFFYVVLSSHDTRDNELMKRNAFHIEAVEESFSHVFKHNCSARYEVGNASG